MLATICADDFMPLLGQCCYFHCAQHPVLELQIQAVRLRPRAQVPTGKRVPFVVELASTQDMGLGDAVGRLALPAQAGLPAQVLHEVWLGRVIPAGRDPAFAYFQLPFN